jgi:diacylglycerol O-acyltransferase
MSPLDAAFLQLEDSEPGTSLAISSTAVFDGPAPGTAEFTEMLAGRLALIPRYRQKARQVPLDLGPPVWVDDEHFDINYHVRRTALPAPGGDAELSALMARVMSARLDRARPLWEYWLVEGLSGGRFALISKIHHCMVDGVSGTDLYHVVLDPTADPRPPTPDDWHPEHEPSGLRLTAAAVAELGHKPVDLASAMVGSLRTPGQLPHRLGEAARGVVALAAGLWPARASSLSGPLSAHRRFAFSRGTVADINAVRKAFGGTFNDVVLAAVSGGFRDLIRARSEEPTPDMVRSLVPVSVRAPGTEDVRNNQVSMMLALLPVEIAEPVERLTAVTTRLAQLKETHEAEVGAAMVALAATEPFAAVAAPVRMMARLPQRSVVTVTTNVPGPRVPLYLLGRRLREIIPYVPIASNLRIGVAILSYRDRIAFGVTGDYDTSADVGVLARAIESGLHDLAALARKKGKRRS